MFVHIRRNGCKYKDGNDGFDIHGHFTEYTKNDRFETDGRNEEWKIKQKKRKKKRQKNYSITEKVDQIESIRERDRSGESFDKRREEKKKETRARTYKGEEMRRREAIIDPARVKRKEARGISRGEERRKEEDVQGMVSVAASLAAGSPQRFVHYKDYTFGVVFSVN